MPNNILFRETTLNNKDEFKKLGILSYGKYASQLAEENWTMMASNINSDAKWVSNLSTSKGFVCANKDNIVELPCIHPS